MDDTACRVLLRSVILAGAALASGCTVLGPEYQEPETAIQDEWSDIETPALSSDPPADPRWWEAAFKDPALDQLVTIATEENLDLRSAALRVLQARQTLAIAIGNQYPQQQDISGTAARERANSRSEELYNIGFGATWEADVWGRFELAIRSAQAQLEASVSDYDAVMVTLLSDLSRNYVNIRTLQRRLEITRANVRLQTAALDIADARYQGGLVTELDVDQARTLLYNTRAALPALEQALQQTRNATAVLLGRPPQALDSLLTETAPIPSPETAVSIGMPQELVRRRPDIRAAERRLAAQSAAIGFAITDLYPSFGLAGFIGGDVETVDGRDFDDLFSSDGSTWSFSGFFQWDVFNYGRLKSNVRLQDATFQQLAVDYQNALLQAQSEVENAVVAFLKSRQQEIEYRASADAAYRAGQLVKDQYQDGLIDFDTVITVLTSLQEQQDVLASTRGAVATNLVEVFRSLGGGWQIRDSHDPDMLLPDAIRQEMLQRTKYWDGVLEQ